MVSRCGLLFAWELCSFAMLLPSGICGPMVAMLNAGSATPPLNGKEAGLVTCVACWLWCVYLWELLVVGHHACDVCNDIYDDPQKGRSDVVYCNAVMLCQATSINSLSTSCGARKTPQGLGATASFASVP